MNVPDERPDPGLAPDTGSALKLLFKRNAIALEQADLLRQSSPALTNPTRWSRVEGMLLGLAVGDALGNRCEAMRPADRASRHGEIRDYLPNHHVNGRRAGTPSDDSQLAFWTLETLIAHGRLDPTRLAERFASERIFGMGRTVREFLHRFQVERREWWNAGPESAGNRALMRIAPVLVPYVDNPSPALWADAAIAGMLTHNDRASTGSCVAFVGLLWELLDLPQPPSEPEWWLDTFLKRLRPLEGKTSYASRTVGGPYVGWSGSLADFLDHHVRDALRRDLPAREACDAWYSGAFLLETVPSAIYILCRHGHDPEEAIVRAVNDTWDNDTVAAIVGAAVGALHGADALPERWRAGLTGRTGATDDGRMFELIAAARKRFATVPEAQPD